MLSFKAFLSHVKRYVFLGILAIIPVSVASFMVDYLYRNVDAQIDRLLPTISGYQVTWFEIMGLLFVLYLIGIISSYLLGKRVNKVTKKIANLFPSVQDLHKELEIAKQVHETIIPESVTTDHFDIAVDYIPCSAIGGDFVQYYFRNPKEVVFMIGDVTGHGLAAALLTNRLHMEFEAQAHKGKSPGAIMKALNLFILRAFKNTNMYFSAFCATINLEKNEMVYSNFGHPPQYINRHSDFEFVQLDAHSTMLGLSDDVAEGKLQSKVQLRSKDRLILFTDGIPETAREGNKRFGIDQFKQDITKHRKISPLDFNRVFLDHLWHFTEKEYEDDVCLMTLDIK